MRAQFEVVNLDLATFLTEDKTAAITFFVSDARISTWRAWEVIDMSDPDTLAKFDYLVEQSEARSAHPFAVAAKEDVTISTPLAALFVGNFLLNWDQINVLPLVNTLEAVWEPGDDSDSKLLGCLFEAIRVLTKLEKTNSVTPDDLAKGVSAFEAVALELKRSERFEVALACAVTASNLAMVLGPSVAEQPDKLVLSLVRRHAAPDVLANMLARHAHLFAQIAAQDPARRIDAFDAFEDALSQLSFEVKPQADLLAMLKSWVDREEYLYMLGPMLWPVFPPKKQSNPALDLASVAVSFTPIWKDTRKEWMQRFDYIRALPIEISNARLALLSHTNPPETRSMWSNWSIQHKILRYAVPHGSSILRIGKEFLDDILLELSHEVTHVYSMFGMVGVTLSAMRWALLELELGIWGRMLDQAGEKPSPEFYERIEAAPLKEPDFVSLGLAERAIEVERKIQVLENTWAPWFEGVALFGELGADPQLDPNWESPVGSVIYNLWDRSLSSIAEDRKISLHEVSKQDREQADSLYATAIHSRGGDRLRTYLNRNHRKYLAGYLAVRSVVSAWRSRLGISLGGDRAFRILLHMTRFSELETMPDLGLPLEDFRKAVAASHLTWIRAMASASANDLTRLLEEGQTADEVKKPLRWVGGSAVEMPADSEAQNLESIVGLATQCLSSLVGEKAPLERVEGADDSCRAMMQLISDAFQKKQYAARIFSADTASAFISRLLILPLGQTACSFWLLEEDHTLACLICSRERDSEQGSPSYDLVVFPLEEDEYAALKQRVVQGGSRRMLVTRVVDLLGGYEDRVEGANFMIFQYDDWMHIQRRGVLFGMLSIGDSLRSAIKHRLSPSPLMADQERLTGEDHPCAKRTIEWIESNKWLIDTGGGQTWDVRPWAERVRRIAREVVSDNFGDVESVEQQLLTFVLGDTQLARKVGESGFAPLADKDHLIVNELIDFLDASARLPLEDNPRLQELSTTVAAELAPLIELTATGWDCVSPKIK